MPVWQLCAQGGSGEPQGEKGGEEIKGGDESWRGRQRQAQILQAKSKVFLTGKVTHLSTKQTIITPMCEEF